MTHYDVWCPDLGADRDDAHMIYAYDHAQAAERWAQWEDAHSADYWIVGGTDAKVCVAEHDNNEIRTFIVSGESVPLYSARQEKTR